MTLLDLADVRLEGALLPEPAQWAAGMTVRAPRDLAALLETGRLRRPDESARAVAWRAAAELRACRSLLTAPTVPARLPVSYRAVPAPVRFAIAHAFGRVQRSRMARWARFPGWPLDLSADLAADLAGEAKPPFTRTPVLLTHDIDSAEGLRNLCDLFLPLEEAVEACSANYVVPCAWPLDHVLLREVGARGHEIGVHGYDHANRTPFAPPAERAQRLDAGRHFGDLYGAQGYRAPSLVRSQDLLDGLADRYSYDSSIPTSGGLFPVPNNGCASARPWRIGPLWELPLSMPRDGSMRFLGFSPDRIAVMWLECANIIGRSGGIVNLLTHCERGFSGNKPMLAAYQSFLADIACDDRFEFVLPAEIVARLKTAERAMFQVPDAFTD